MSQRDDQPVCPNCGYDNSSPYDRNYRRPGSTVGERFIIGRLIRKNGEGAVYIGYDDYVQKRIWIREYYPYTIAQRDIRTGDVLAKEGCEAQFKALMSDFVDVCNDVKRMGVTEPVVPIETVIGEHGTVYAIYKDIHAVPLEKWLGSKGGKLEAAEALDLLLPLMNTLSNIHARGVIHRGISPYTVYMGRDGRLYLWDFCLSATRTGGSELHAELFNGYAAPEQYASNGWQGTWTDVYGVAALFYRVVSGFVPPKSTMISEHRPLAPLIDLAELPQNISDAVQDAMLPDATQRTQDIGPFVSQLVQTDLSSTAVYDVSMVNEVKKNRERKREIRAEKRRRGKYMFLGLLITVLLLIGAIYVTMSTFFPELLTLNETDRTSSSSAPVYEEEIEDPDEEGESESPEQDKTMPNLVGQRVADVTGNPEYTEGRFVFEIREEYTDQYEEGIIYDHSPGPGVIVPDGRMVILKVSKGKRIFEMPDLTGKTTEEAVEILQMMVEAQGSNITILYNLYPRYSDVDVEPLQVVGTTPVAGEEFDPQETRISIFYMPESSSNETTQVDREASRNDDDNRRNSDDRSDDWRDALSNRP